MVEASSSGRAISVVAGGEIGDRANKAVMKELAVALGLTLLAQTMISIAVFAPSVLAPVAQGDVGVRASSIGLFTSILYAVAAWSAPLGGTFVARFGGVRVSQFCVLSSGCGIALCTLAHPLAVVAGAALIGCGYGPVTPASSEILVARTPERLRNLVISIRQTGVPVGGAIAGAVIPLLLLIAGWKAAALAIAAASLLTVVCLQFVRSRYDGGRMGAAAPPRPSLYSLLRMVFSNRELRQNALASFIYGGMQMSLASFLVVFLTERANLTLVNAGIALSVAMVAGIAGRVLWGVVADRVGNARLVLGLLGIVMALASILTSQISPDWPFGAILVLCAVFGATAIGWNGVYIAEIARIAPNGDVALATGASLMYTYLGVVCAPVVFWLVLRFSESYAIAYCGIGLVTLRAGISYLHKPRAA